MEVLHIHPSDDMAVALVDLDEGSQIEVGDTTLRLTSSVPAKHKIDLRDLPAGSTPRLYGMPAGRTTRAVWQGEAVSPHNLEGLRSGGDGDLPQLMPWVPPDLSNLPRTFQGYLRPDGRVGTRNHLLVTYTVPCVRKAAERVAAAVRRALGFERENPWVYYAREGHLLPAQHGQRVLGTP